MEKMMQTAATAWHNGLILEKVGVPALSIHNYRVAYMARFDFNLPYIGKDEWALSAIEDADADAEHIAKRKMEQAQGGIH